MVFSFQTFKLSRVYTGCLPWMDDTVLYFLAVFQSYQDDGWVIMKAAVCNGTLFTIEKIPTFSRVGTRDSCLGQ